MQEHKITVTISDTEVTASAWNDTIHAIERVSLIERDAPMDRTAAIRAAVLTVADRLAVALDHQDELDAAEPEHDEYWQDAILAQQELEDFAQDFDVLAPAGDLEW